MMPRRELFLLGPFKARIDGDPVAGLTSAKLQGLLAYLALEAVGPWPREQLAALLWPEKPEARAAHSLRQGLYQVNKRLALAGEPDVLAATRQTAALEPEAEVWVDAVALPEAVAATARHAHRAIERCQECCTRLAAATELYRGQLLEGVQVESEPFEEWLRPQRQRLERQVLEALGTLVDYYGGQDEWEQAQQQAFRQVELAPWYERGHRQLMQALAAQGRRSEALAAYETCRQMLAETLGVAPEAETVAVYRSLQKQEVPAPVVSRTVAPAAVLPRAVTAFVGREQEMAEVQQRLDRPSCALLTILGPGGVGKTRLAVEAARRRQERYPDGVYFVPLAPLADPALLPLAIANSLQLSLAGPADPAERLLEHLRQRQLLLILDNVEHLLDPGLGTELDLLPHLLQEAPGVQLLVTSRTALNYHAEWLYEIGGLPYPEEDAAGEMAVALPAMTLFLGLAQRRQPDFSTNGEWQAVAQLCRLVEGMPLALELAAAQLPGTTPAQIVADIAANLDNLATTMRDVPPRQRSLGAVFRSSWQLLTAGQKETLRWLAPFSGGFTERAAAEVAAATPAILGALLDRSFLRLETTAGEEVRYQMHEVLRAYVQRELGVEAVVAARRHADYFAAFTEARLKQLNGEEQKKGLALMSRDFDNVITAWRWSLGEGQTALLGRFTDGLWAYLDDSGLYRSGLALFERALAAAESSGAAEGEPAEVWAGLRKAAGFFHQSLGQYGEARRFYEQSLATYRRLDNMEQSARCLYYLGSITAQAGQLEDARAYLQEALFFFHRLEIERYIANTTATLGSVLEVMGRYEEAEEMLREALVLKRQRGNPLSTAVTLNNLALLLWRTGRYEESEACFRETLALRREVGNLGKIALGLSNLACLLITTGDYEQARLYLQESLALEETVGNKRHTAGTLNYMGHVCHLLGEREVAHDYLAEALAVAVESDNRREEASARLTLARMLLDEGDQEGAAQALARALKLATALQLRPLVLDTLVPVARLLLRRGETNLARQVLTHPLHHAAAWYETREKARALAAEGGAVVDGAGNLEEMVGYLVDSVLM